MEDFEEFDAAALLASINSNLEEALNSNDKEIKSEDNFENSPIKKEKKKGFSPGKHEKNPELIKDEENKETLKPQEIQKSNIFTIVRDSPEVIEEIDPLLQTLQRIKIV